MMVDTSKPLLQDRPPAYHTVAAATGTYGGGGGPPPPAQQGPPLLQQGNYGAIPPAAGYHPHHQPPPPPYQYPTTTAGPGYPGQAISQQPYTPHPQTYTIIQPSVVVVGGCPACRVGVLEDDFTCLGIMCAIFFFPLGILFCFALRQRRCPNCGATFG